MSLQTTFVELAGVTVVRCSGRIVAGPDIEKFDHELNLHFARCKRFVLNLSGVHFLDSSGIGMIVRFAGAAKSAHGGFRICEPSEVVSRLLKLTRLDCVLEISATEADALSALASKTAVAPAASEGPKIICVDASVNVLAYLRALLSQHGYSVTTTANAYDARSLVKAIHPVLLILGPNVPGMHLEHFQQAVKGIPVLALGPEFHADEAGAAAEALVARIVATIDSATKAASS